MATGVVRGAEAPVSAAEPAARTPDPFHALGVTLTGSGGEARVFSATATQLDLCIFDERDPTWVERSVRMNRDAHGVWSAHSPLLTPGRRYSIRADGPDGPRNSFLRDAHLIDPYARGLVRIDADAWRSVVVTDDFDWGGVTRPNTPLADSVIYEAHVKGLTKQLKSVPAQLRGTYAGLAHESTIRYLTDLGVTAVELLPVHAFGSERRLLKQGLANYWGYNSVGFFAPHAPYASASARGGGAQAVLTEFKGMVRLLHEAGIEVILDVVYNHTAEEGSSAPPFAFRGLDNSTYYRQDDSGRYIDSSGCGNSLDFSQPVTQRLVQDSIRYWANEMQIDGFRFDLAVTLGRDGNGGFNPEHSLLSTLAADPALAGVKLIAEPWDVGMGGWQTGGFPRGWSEWNDRYRDGVRDFWLTDADVLRHGGLPRAGLGAIAQRLSGSSETFGDARGPLASVNYVTAHDGFTLADVTSYNSKRNLGNGESNRDGTDNNRAFDFGAEGLTRNEVVLADRRRAMRNLLGTLLLAAGVPMLLAGDEFGRTQRGNNNAYCHDGPLTWLNWTHAEWQTELLGVTRRLIALRREHPALRPSAYAASDGGAPGVGEMHWFDGAGNVMTQEAWQAPERRTLQYLACTATDARGRADRILLVVSGAQDPVTVTLPTHTSADGFTLLWSSADDDAAVAPYEAGAPVELDGPTMLLFRAAPPRRRRARAAHRALEL